MKWNRFSKKEKEEHARFHVARNYGGCFPDAQSEEMAISCYMDAMEFSANLPLPASAEDEAARLYPYDYENYDKEDHERVKAIRDAMRLAHITCAGMYTDTIDKLKAENSKMRKALEKAQVLAKRGIFPHLPVEVVGAQMCIDIDKLVTETLKKDSNE